MSAGRTSGWPRLGCAALIGAAIAFPLGIMVGGKESPGGTAAVPGRPGPVRGKAPKARNFYSPRVTSDPYVIDQQRRVVQALEASCRQSGLHCAEAEQARLRIEEAQAGR